MFMCFSRFPLLSSFFFLKNSSILSIWWIEEHYSLEFIWRFSILCSFQCNKEFWEPLFRVPSIISLNLFKVLVFYCGCMCTERNSFIVCIRKELIQSYHLVLCIFIACSFIHLFIQRHFFPPSIPVMELLN